MSLIAAADVMNTMTPAEISDPQELIARATALSLEFATPIAPLVIMAHTMVASSGSERMDT